MKKLPSLPTSLRRVAFLATFFAVAVAGSWITPTGWSQAPAATTPNAALTPLLTKIKAQQDQTAANQTKIEAQTVQLKEEIRQLKIYAARSGAKR